MVFTATTGTLRSAAVRRLRGHWQPLVDLGLAAATALLFVLSGTIVATPLAVAQLVPLVWRRRFPAAVLIVVGCATAAHTTLGMARAVGFFPATIALYTAATHRSPRIRWVLCPAVGLIMAAASAVRHGPVEGLLMAVVTVTVAWLAGVERSQHLRQRAEAERQRAEATHLRLERRIADQATAAAEDRERLARRVHDTLAHTVTVMLLQTEALKATTSLGPAAGDRLDVVLRAGREALAEVRAALADADEPDSAVLLATRLQTLQAAGLRLAGDPPDLRRELAAPVRAVADRLIGEAATNALRHDGPGALLTITTGRGEHTLILRITSEPADPSRDGRGPDGGGFGLLSLAEDLTGYGGKLVHGPLAPAGWRIEASFPLPARAAVAVPPGR
ncbi:histidine kinase [Amorphoplanes auranticolor]|uniref:histidine kinase n=1 Tax=Actinoplanes auranticolor TaxID=47988 RepID=A0A919VQY5_9ACTN|nr:histidine kinase [Actinoplanes auranticolor]GIM73076.1 histidine kinase [Actinoplanes auranticolor]